MHPACIKKHFLHKEFNVENSPDKSPKIYPQILFRNPIPKSYSLGFRPKSYSL